MKLTYDGHGLNDAEHIYRRRVMTWQCMSPDHGGGFVIEDDKERNRLGRLLAAAPDLLAAGEEVVRRFDELDASAPARAARLHINALRLAIAKARP
jgi:hypothetical protein